MSEPPASDGAPERVLLVFLDGVGVGEEDPARNPFLSADLPIVRALLGGIPTRGAAAGPHRGWTSADAVMGVPGLPQSGTGQTSLLTGINAAARMGRHFGPWVPTTLRDLLAAENLLTRAAVAGLHVAFANATPASHSGPTEGVWRRPAAPPLAARAAGAELRGAPELRAGRAVASSITNEKWRQYADPAIPEIAPAEAGRVLAGITARADLTLFAHYDTDLVGHRGSYRAAVAALERVDAFLGGVLSALPPDTLLVVASDHGNVEDVTRGHTLNEVLVIATGPGAGGFLDGVGDISHVAPLILRALGAV